MPYSDTITAPDGEWVLLTKGGNAAGDVSVEALGTGYIVATVGAVKPQSLAGAQLWQPGMAQLGTTIAKIFPGVAGGNNLWGRGAAGGPCDFAVSYA